MTAALPFITAGIGAIGALTGIMGATKKAPSTPEPTAAPAAPTVTDAQQEADQESITSQRKGALANLLQPTGAQTSTNTSLRSFLGG